jgi:hypothetical protein
LLKITYEHGLQVVVNEVEVAISMDAGTVILDGPEVPYEHGWQVDLDRLEV